MIEVLRKLIIETADYYIQENDVTEEQIVAIDNFADALISNVERLQELANAKR